MKVSSEKFLEHVKAFLKDEFVPQLQGENRRFWIGSALKAITPQSVGLIIELFPEAKMIAPILKASGILCEGQIDVDKLEEIITGGFELSNNEVMLSFELPAVLDPEKTRVGMKLTPRVWEIFKRGLR